MPKKVFRYALGGILYFTIRILARFNLTGEATTANDVRLAVIESILWLVIMTFIMEFLPIIFKKIGKKK